MAETISERFARWQLQELLVQYPGLRIQPGTDERLKLAGDLKFRATGPDGLEVEDSYQVELIIPSSFPQETPLARETGGRIAITYHKLRGGYLCLGTPTELRLRLIRSPTLLSFIERIVIPYLYGHTYYQAHGTMPFDELEHGTEGLLQHFMSLFSAPSRAAARMFVQLAALRRRLANKQACACGSGRRLGRCCNRRINRLRDLLGRSWFQSQHRLLREEN